MDNVIPICVIPATTPRITSYIPMALIKEHKKENETIICLTMCDRLQEENIEELLVNRIAMITDEYDSDTFNGVCGIINRTHKNNIKLCDHDNVEKKWFEDNIYNTMPVDYCHKSKLLSNLGIDKLVEKLSTCYKKYVDEKWIPNIIKKIKKDNLKLEVELSQIGFDPNNNEDKKKFLDIFNIFAEKHLYDYLKNSISKNYVTKDYNLETLNHFINYLPINNINFDYFEYIEEIDEYIEEIDHFGESNYNILINITRFSDFNLKMKEIINHALDKFYGKFIEKYLNLIEYDIFTSKNLDNIISRNIDDDKKLNNLFKNYIKEFSLHFNSLIDEDFEKLSPGIFELKEDTFEIRNKINSKINNNVEAIQDLENIKIN